MLIQRADPINASQITPRQIFLNRRQFIAGAGAIAGAASLLSVPRTVPALASDADSPGHKLSGIVDGGYNVEGGPHSWKTITSYNNFYEFGTGKSDPVENAQKFKTRPWSVNVFGECEKPGKLNFEDFIKPHTLEERIYRFRCVEAWSMVVPWVGIPLNQVLKRFAPTSKAKYVGFRTLYDPVQMPGQRRRVLDWPYVEGLRMDEAMHPLTLLVVGLYGEVLPNQNGAPLRLIVPWKYGFKSIKSIVSMGFLEQQPKTSWNLAAPSEYGFYSNVNPKVPHPRWSQAKERVVGEFFKRKTLAFNGYADQVASLYTGMDLKKFF